MTPGPKIRLDCLGSAFAFSSGGYWNGWLLNGRVLLDCPPQTLAHLYRLGRTPADIDLVLLSHEHFDHVGGMDSLLLDAVHRHAAGRPAPWAVAGPDGIFARVEAIVGDRGHRPRRDDPACTWLEHDGGVEFEWAGVAVETVRMQHAVPDNGYRVRIDGGVVAYTGDTAPGPHIAQLAAGADVLIVECGGGALPTGLDGKSLLPFLEGNSPEDWPDSVYCESHGEVWGYSSQRMVRSERWKYVYAPNDMDELDDLEADPAELRNLIDDASSADTLKQMKARLIGWNDATDDMFQWDWVRWNFPEPILPYN